MVRVVVKDAATRGVRRDDNERDAGAVAEEVDRLHVAGVVVAAAFVEGDEDGGVLPQSRVGLDFIDDLLGEAFEQVELRGGRVSVDEAARLDDRNCRQGCRS